MIVHDFNIPPRRARRIMNRDVPDEKEPREAPKILVTAFYARSGPSWGRRVRPQD